VSSRPSIVVDRSAVAADVRRLSVLSSWRSAAAIAREWTLIGGVAGAAIWMDHPVCWLLAVVLIATRQHALLILMHEGAHHRLFTDRKLNDAVSDLLLAFPLNVSTTRYRRLHGRHHRHTNQASDPDRATIAADDQWQFPRSRRSAVAVALRDLTGVNLPRTLRAFGLYAPWTSLVERVQGNTRTGLSNAEIVRLVVVQAVIGAGLFLTDGWVAFGVLWVLPTATVLPLLLRIRGVAEHEGVPGGDEVQETRHVDAGRVEAFLLSPFHINFHTAHHLFPSVPWYNLPALHARLMEEPAYASRLVRAPSYTGPGGVFDELTQVVRPSATPALVGAP
jgi:fatty acid desaturase